MQLQAGKRYVTRDGEVTGSLTYSNDGPYKFTCPLWGNTWRADGSYYNAEAPDAFDIVSEIVEPGGGSATAAVLSQEVRYMVVCEGGGGFTDLDAALREAREFAAEHPHHAYHVFATKAVVRSETVVRYV